MDFDLNEEQRALRELCGQVAGAFDDEYWQGIDAECRFPREYWDSLADHGILGIAVPEEYGGSGLGVLEVCLAGEALSEAGAGEGGAMFILGPVFGGCLIDSVGSPAQKEKYLPGIVRGDIWSGAFTEPDAGSNVSKIRTRAIDEGDHYRISGQKAYISNVPIAQHIAIMCRTRDYDSESRTSGVSLLVGDLPNDRVESQPFKKMGSRFMDTSMVFFDDYEVPKENLVGVEGKGWRAVQQVFNPERLVTAASCVGTGNFLIRRAVEYASERSIWDAPLASHQGLQFPLAEARIALETARIKVYEAAWLYDRGRECGIESAMARFAAARAALFAADRAIQTFGGAGYVSESGIERHWRNLRLNRIAPVTEEMTLNYIAQHDLGMPRSY
ncbi:MAG: acyl-CoA/acyl-ACP dehydrogenase [Deltaproteobacteria bacterium]|nr:acyl-CoA/acyl-ACP dehydrogenase [Deltaproteobacteria bacterium]MBW2499593.1 acyl-CoA/acyl-ACP dehydrogenase [Deltaproteobacteria bacterium]